MAKGKERKKKKRKKPMLLWIALYHHQYGVDSIPFFQDTSPTEQDVIAILSDWEGDERYDEIIEIEGPYPMPGSANYEKAMAHRKHLRRLYKKSWLEEKAS